MDRILIIGINGSGKSTFANELGKRLNREVTHLDKISYEPGLQNMQTKDQWEETVLNLVSKQKWIMDGHYHDTLKIRLPAADTVFFFNFNKVLCLGIMLKRVFKKAQPFDEAKGSPERLSWELVKKIIKFPRGKILNMLEEYKNSKKIIIFKNTREVYKYLDTLKV